ncbi:MAG: antitoxin VapB family protein [Candidatus Helarchaeota archaeon]
MTQKTISLPEDVYEKLKAEKRENESFAQLILRLLKQEKSKTPIEPLAGIFEKDSSEWEEIERNLYNDRLRYSQRDDNFIEE